LLVSEKKLTTLVSSLMRKTEVMLTCKPRLPPPVSRSLVVRLKFMLLLVTASRRLILDVLSVLTSTTFLTSLLTSEKKNVEMVKKSRD